MEENQLKTSVKPENISINSSRLFANAGTKTKWANPTVCLHKILHNNNSATAPDGNRITDWYFSI